jgi:hypothetical protein
VYSVKSARGQALLWWKQTPLDGRFFNAAGFRDFQNIAELTSINCRLVHRHPSELHFLHLKAVEIALLQGIFQECPACMFYYEECIQTTATTIIMY